jgi:hypothetical protein
MTESSLPVGEVVESSTPQFAVACYELFAAPPFGSLVKAPLPGGSGWIFGIVYDVSTGSEPPGAQVTVRGRSGLSDEAIYKAYPDLEELMRTRFQALTVGFMDGGVVRQYLPPQPPKLHYSVYPCPPDEVRLFSEQLGYLRAILTNLNIPSDDLAAAAIRQACDSRPADGTFALRAGRQLAMLLKEEYDRLRAILARIGA